MSCSSLTGFNLMALISQIYIFLMVFAYVVFSPSLHLRSLPPHFSLHGHFSVPFCFLILLIQGVGKKTEGGKGNSTTNHQELNMRETRGEFLEFSGFVINKSEVSVLKIIFRVPVMRQNQRKWLATDVSMNYVCVADTHQHHLLLFPSQYTLNDKTHTCTHLHCQLTGELGLLKSCVFFF